MKSICIPCSGPVEVGDYLPIIDHPLFQRLRHCRQLGLNDLIFPGAQHTRFEHALGVLARTRQAAHIQHFDSDQQRALELFALLHDLGHGPCSHQVEPVLAQNHHQRGLLCLERMADAIQACGGSLELLQAMLSGEHPLGAWISDRNLGTDKLDYLERDAFHIGFIGMPDIATIQRQTLFADNNILALNEKFIEDGKRLQKFYSYLHQHGYLNKTALAAQRLMQRALQEELLLVPDRAAAEEEIWELNDAQLFAWLAKAKSKLARQLAARLANRSLYRTCLCIKPEGYAYVENTVGKPIVVKEWSRAKLLHFSHTMHSLERLRDLEDRLAAAVKLAPGEVVLAAMPYFTKLLPKDLRIANGGPGDYWLFEKDRDHKASLESDYLRTFAVRIVVPSEYRKRLAEKPEPLLEILEG
ncbi:MAG: HD domain-containing protein [Victivallales bacterium]|nr:HD domain-containing protein [Victivallales bacterium]